MSTFPGIAGRIQDLIGTEAATAILRRWGGCQLELPKRTKGSELAAMIGEAATGVLIKELGSGRITLPCGSMRGLGRRRADAMAMLRRGASLQEVALAHDLHTRTVSKYRALIEAEGGGRQKTLDL